MANSIYSEQEIRQTCNEWMENALKKDFDPQGIKKYTFDQLYKGNIEPSEKLNQKIKEIYIENSKNGYNSLTKFPDTCYS